MPLTIPAAKAGQQTASVEVLRIDIVLVDHPRHDNFHVSRVN
jgi:hypothetical protein